MTISEKLLYATKLLFPTGRAFRISENSVKEKIEKGTIESEVRAHNDLVSILDTILPDNDNFSAEDATRWEERLGMIVNDQVSLADRKLAIKRKMNHPGDIIARQSRDYIESQLQLAGFDVYILFDQNNQNPALVLTQLPDYNCVQLGDSSQMSDDVQLGDVYTVYSNLFSNPVQLGDYQLGDFQLNEQLYLNKVANSIDEQFDETFNVADYSCSFAISGPDPNNFFASVPIERKEEFRQLILKLKPAQNCAILYVNYI